MYKENFNKFFNSLEKTIAHVKEELMPDYDYDEFDRRREEYEGYEEEGSFEKQSNVETEKLSARWED